MDQVTRADSFRSLSLPRVGELLCSRNPRSVDVAIDSTGTITLCRMPMGHGEFRAVIAKAVADSAVDGHSPEVRIGADAQTPFDKVWPVLLACCSSGVWKVGFAVSAGDQTYMNALDVCLPQVEANPPYRSPLVLKGGGAFTAIGLQTNGLVIAHLKRGVVIDQERIGMSGFVDRGKIDTDRTLAIVPSQGVSYGDVATLVYWCHRFHVETIGLFREDAMPLFDHKKK